MAAKNKREQLVSFLDRNAFDPVLETAPERYDSESDQKKLKDLKETTRREKERYHED